MGVRVGEWITEMTLLDGYPAGRWFMIDNRAILADFQGGQWSSKSGARPVIALADFDGRLAGLKGHPRSTTSDDGYKHKPHPRGHHPKCCIDKPGRVVYVYVTVLARDLVGRDRCDEPDRQLLDAILA